MFIMILYVMIFFRHLLCKNNNKKTKMKRKVNFPFAFCSFIRTFATTLFSSEISEAQKENRYLDFIAWSLGFEH